MKLRDFHILAIVWIAMIVWQLLRFRETYGDSAFRLNQWWPGTKVVDALLMVMEVFVLFVYVVWRDVQSAAERVPA